MNNEMKLIKMHEKIKKLELENKIKEQQLTELRSKMDYIDVILNSGESLTIEEIAIDYGLAAIDLYIFLQDKGIYSLINNNRVLKSEFVTKGYAKNYAYHRRKFITDEIIFETRWTTKGRLFLDDLLKNNGYSPLIER